MSAAGLEFAGSAAGLISLSLTIFRGCVQAFEIIQSAIHAGNEADNFWCKLELEKYKLVQWAERIGLERQPDHQFNWGLVADTLKQLESLLSDTQILSKRYGLELVQVESTVLAHEAVLPQKDTGLYKLLSRLRRSFRTASSRIIHGSNDPLRKLRWAAFDKDKAAKLIEEIVYFNNSLYCLLDNVNQDFIKSALGSILRDMISDSDTCSEIHIIKQLLCSTYVSTPDAVASAATLEQIRLALGRGNNTVDGVGRKRKRAPSNVVVSSLRLLDPALPQRESAQSIPDGREFSFYGSKPVMIEWKLTFGEEELRVRIEQVAILLGHTKDSSYHSLRGIGILPAKQFGSIGYSMRLYYSLVSDLSFPGPSCTRSSPVTRSLLSLYKDTRRPSLNERRTIAIALAETVLQLHASGWLHKGIRSEDVLTVEDGDHTWSRGTAFGPYLAGYEYARPEVANVSEETKGLFSEEMPCNTEKDIYRHPRCVGPARDRFQVSFDLFALGCVLLEVALGQIWRMFFNDNRFISIIGILEEGRIML